MARKYKHDLNQLQKLPKGELSTLCMHLVGIDIHTKISEPTYYSHRRYLKTVGYDLDDREKLFGALAPKKQNQLA